jgi:predicted MPP superfamily phosphohydrolase
MVFAPLIAYTSAKYGFESFARFSAYIGFTWMGIAFLFLASSILLDLFRIIFFAGGFILKRSLVFLTPLWLFIIPLLFSLSAGVYGFFEARDIRTERVVIKSSKIPREAGPVRIVQITDVHLGMIVRAERLSSILDEVKKADPDLLVSTGDLVDAQINHLDGLTDLLREIRPKYGKFAITGNHEYFAGLQQSLDFTRRAGFTMLRGEGLTVGGLFNLAGVDDLTGQGFGLWEGLSEKNLLASLPRNKFTILLKHRPIVDKNSLGLFDLQISGHTHKGQIFPFRIFTRIFFPYHGGLFELPNKALLYVSRGSGTWGPPIRFLTPPEVTIFELIPGD